MKITIIHNGAHGYTDCSIIVQGNPGEEVKLTNSQIKKLDAAGCPCSQCTCGETLLCALSDWGLADDPHMIRIPEEGSEIKVNGNYPQQ